MRRLKTRPQFQAVLAGKIIAKTAHFALHRHELGEMSVSMTADTDPPTRLLFETTQTWIGAMVPKRWAKRAVTRNTIKRQIYSVSCELCVAFQAAAYVVRLRKSFDRAQFSSATSDALKQAVRAEVQLLLKNVSATA